MMMMVLLLLFFYYELIMIFLGVDTSTHKGGLALAKEGKIIQAGISNYNVENLKELSKHTKKADWKKAMVQLAKGQKIDVFEVTSEQGTQGEKADSGKK